MLDKLHTDRDADRAATTGPTRSTTDNIRELTDASKQLFEAGKQMTESLSDISNRVEHASDVGSQVLRSPWLLAGSAFLAGLLVLAFSRKR